MTIKSTMTQMKTTKIRRLSILSFCVFIGLLDSSIAIADEDIQFNTDVLDVKDKSNLDLSHFSKRGYIMPGDYAFKIKVNQNELEELTLSFYPVDDASNETKACLSSELVKKFGFKDEYFKQLTTWHNNECVDFASLAGVIETPDLGRGILAINVPQAYLEFVSDNWVPSGMWDNGVPGLLADYNVSAQSRKLQHGGTDNTASGNGVVGANIGPWRLRADWQGNYSDPANNGSGDSQSKGDFAWSRYYLYRAIPSLKAKLTLGEDYVSSDLFDSFRFAGASLVTDDTMLPPNLRGYAPEVTGVARTNAKVTISQQGRVLYETQVAAGPFAIQSLNNAVTGSLDVQVQEQDGSVQNYKVNTANVPYLTRPGSVRYKIFAGRPMGYNHNVEGSEFGSSEFSWGVSNGWSLYGGLVSNKDYRSAALGVGRDLLILGAVAFDVTRSDTTLNEKRMQGQSYRVSYSKRFEETDSQVTFAGYRFSEKEFMSFNDYLNYISQESDFQKGKEMYTITFSQQLPSLGISAYVNYSHQTFWNSPTEDRYNLSVSRYFDIGKFKNISASLSAYRNKFDNREDDGLYVSVSIPWGDTGSISYNSSLGSDSRSNRLSYFDRLSNGDNYQVTAGTSDSNGSLSGYYTHEGNSMETSANVDYQEGEYSALGMTMHGGFTATTKGAALHRTSTLGGTRIMVDTGDAQDIPVIGYTGADTRTNLFGKAVITDVSSYSKNSLKININELPEDAEAPTSVVQATLTEGAIGYRKFDVVSGMKAMAVIRLADGSFPPFGATVNSEDEQELGIVNDEGDVYLVGLKPKGVLNVIWNGEKKCRVTVPEKIMQQDPNSVLLLPCHQ